MTSNGPNNSQATSDLKFNNSNSTDCYGLVDTNDSLARINALNWGSNRTLLDKTDDIGSGSIFQSLSFTLTSDVSKPNGNWVLAVSDAAGGLNLPTYMDLVFALKAADYYAAYLFTGMLVDGSDSGTYHISWNNNGGQIAGFSHMSLYGRAGSNGGGTPPLSIPEPGVFLCPFQKRKGLNQLQHQAVHLRRRLQRTGFRIEGGVGIHQGKLTGQYQHAKRIQDLAQVWQHPHAAQRAG